MAIYRGVSPQEYAASIGEIPFDNAATTSLLEVLRSENDGGIPTARLETAGLLDRLVVVSYVGKRQTARYVLGSAYGTFKEGKLGQSDTVAGHIGRGWVVDGKAGLLLRNGVYLDPNPRFTYPVGDLNGIAVSTVMPSVEGGQEEAARAGTVMGILAEQ